MPKKKTPSIPDISRVFVKGVRLGEEVIEDVRRVGEVKIPTGKLIICDPTRDAPAQPLARTIPPGNYTVTAAYADSVVAYARLTVQPGKPARWELAPFETAKPKAAKDIFPADNGLAAYMDVEAYQRVEQNKAAGVYPVSFEEDVIDRVLGEGDQAMIALDERLNLALVRSGYGEGQYRSYWGFDEAGEPLCLVTDFQVIPLEALEGEAEAAPREEPQRPTKRPPLPTLPPPPPPDPTAGGPPKGTLHAFWEKHWPPTHITPVPEETLDTYRDKLPNSIVLLWRQMGLCAVGDEFLWIIDPAEHEKRLHRWLTKAKGPKDLVPFMRTGLGDVLLWSAKKGLYVFNVHDGRVQPQGDNAEIFLTHSMCEDGYLDMGLDRRTFNKVKARLGPLEPGECYARDPAAKAAGKRADMKKVSADAHYAALAKRVEPYFAG